MKPNLPYATPALMEVVSDLLTRVANAIPKQKPAPKVEKDKKR